VGRAGAAGAQGPAGATGAQGPAGIVDRWNAYREFSFDVDKAELQPGDASKVSEIAAYLKKNPSLQVGIDGSISPRTAGDTGAQDLSDRRVNAVRTSLIQAGVPAEKIKIGAFGDSRQRRDGRVELLISTGS
jgi:outer membrane protein OmpA-like peptidoglycan-associated protein